MCKCSIYVSKKSNIFENIAIFSNPALVNRHDTAKKEKKYNLYKY